LREIIADLFVTLDGFAAGVDAGPYFDYGGPELDAWVRNELDQPQVILMGRVTYEALSSISMQATDDVGASMTELPKVVFSNTLTEPLAWGGSRLLKGDLGSAIRELKSEAGDPIRSIGSLRLVRGLMELALVDRLRLMVFPLVLGSAGREPAFSGHSRRGLELVGTQVLDSRLVVLEYRPASRSTG
jgi:dihydrofolate reductase